MGFLNDIKNRVLIYDGSKGVMLQKEGLAGGECPELWNVEHPEIVGKIHKAYKDAGANVIQTNTFQGNREALEKYSLGNRVRELNLAGVKLAKEIMGKDGYVAASVGPIGRLFEPSGDLIFEKAYELFKEQIKALAEGGVDIIHFETFTDLAEMRVALIAAKDNTTLPIICSLAYEENGKTLMGTDPYTAGIVLKSLGADVIGANCSFGPKNMIDIIKEMSRIGDIPLMVKPNAGLPETVKGKTVYKDTPAAFAKYTAEFIKYGVKLIGGCCGTTPVFVEKIKDKAKDVELPKIQKTNEQIITSPVKSLSLQKIQSPNLEMFRSEKEDDEVYMMLLRKDMELITDIALDIASEKHDAIYINVDSVKHYKDLLAQVVNVMQSYIKEPLIIETESHVALEKALRIYKGKAGVVIGAGLHKDIAKLILVAKKYGSTVIDKVAIDRIIYRR